MLAHRRRPPDFGALVLALPLLTTLFLAACGGGAPGTAGAPTPGTTSEAEWRALATPRPAPLPGAPTVSVGEVQILSSGHMGLTSTVDPGLGVAELVAAGLLRRQDVSFVERRRFAAAADAERRGQPRKPGAPPAGVSRPVDFVLVAAWSSLGLDSAYLDVRLTDRESGDIVGTRRVTTPGDADPAGLARTVVGTLLGILDDLGRRPAWTDPVAGAAPAAYRSSGVPVAAVDGFLRGLAAEDRWDWEGARAGYQAALQQGGSGFFEASAALARTARLRLGGTLGAS